MDDDGSPEGGTRRGAALGTSWHGLLEGDAVRRALLAWVAARRGRQWRPGTESFAAVRERRLDASATSSRSTSTWRRSRS